MASVIWSKNALDNLDQIASYLQQTSPYYAASVVDAIVVTAEKIPLMPHLGPVVARYRNPNIRERLCHKYRIIYHTGDDAITILTVIHGARLLPRHL